MRNIRRPTGITNGLNEDMATPIVRTSGKVGIVHRASPWREPALPCTYDQELSAADLLFALSPGGCDLVRVTVRGMRVCFAIRPVLDLSRFLSHLLMSCQADEVILS